MDPLSIATGVAGLVLLAYQIAQEVDLLIQEIKGLPDELAKLGTQIQHLSAALSDFREFFIKRVVGPQAVPLAEGDRERFMPSQRWLESMEKLLMSLVGTIRDLEKILRGMKAKTNKFARHWKWQSSKVELAMLNRDLDRNVQTLLVMMSTFTSMSDAYLREEVYHISTQVSASNKGPEVSTTEVPSAAIFKMPSFPRSNSSFALLSSFPSLSLFRTESSKSDQARDEQDQLPAPPPYASVIDSRAQLMGAAGCYHHGEERFCAIVKLSPMSTTFLYSRDKQDMQTKFNDAVSQGLRMVSINVHVAPDGSWRYCHTYVKPVHQREQMPWYAAWDLDLGSFNSKHKDLAAAGYVCVHIDVCGRPRSSNLFAGVWEKPNNKSPLSSEVVHSLSQKEMSAMFSQYFTAQSGEDRVYRSSSGISAYEDGTGYIKFATVFVNYGKIVGNLPTQVATLLLTRAELERQMVEQKRGGYHLASIHPFALTGQEFFNCTWQKADGNTSSQSHVGISREALERVQREHSDGP